MKKNWLKGTGKLVSLMVTASLLLSAVACGGAATTAGNSSAAVSTIVKSDSQVPATEEKAANIKMITWVQETNQAALEALNKSFTEKHSNITFTVDTVAANDYPTLLNTRISAGDVDIVSNVSAFDTLPQNFTKGCDKPAWQTFVESGAYLDITDQPFVKNWNESMIKDAVSYNGKVFGLDMGAVGYNGVFYNKKLFADNGLTEPGTWDELVKVCKTFQGKGISPVTLGMKDSWPLSSCAVSGIVGANETDLTAFAKGLWNGSRKFTDDKTMIIWNRMEQFISFLEPNVAAVSYGDAPGRFVAGKAAMLYDGTWNAGAITALDGSFEFGYFPIPGDVSANPNQLQGKYDMQFNIFAKTANKDVCLQWFDFLSQKENYTPFVSALGFFPTMPGVESTSKFVNSIADKNKAFKPSWEKTICPPKGIGQYASGQCFSLSTLKAVGGTVKDVKTLSELAQKDWDSAIKAIN